MEKTTDRTEAMILEVEKNRVLYDKSDKNYKDCMQNVVKLILCHSKVLLEFCRMKM